MFLTLNMKLHVISAIMDNFAQTVMLNPAIFKPINVFLLNDCDFKASSERRTITARVCRGSAHNTINTIQSHGAPCHRGWASGYLCFLLGIYNLPSLESQRWCVNRQQELSIKRGHHLRPPPSLHTDLSTSGLPQANTAPGGPRLTNPSSARDSDGNGI